MLGAQTGEQTVLCPGHADSFSMQGTFSRSICACQWIRWLVYVCACVCISAAQARVFQQQRVHTELISTLYGSKAWMMAARLPRSAPVNPDKLLQLWDYEGGLTRKVGTSVCMCVCVGVCVCLCVICFSVL